MNKQDLGTKMSPRGRGDDGGGDREEDKQRRRPCCMGVEDAYSALGLSALQVKNIEVRDMRTPELAMVTRSNGTYRTRAHMHTHTWCTVQ